MPSKSMKKFIKILFLFIAVNFALYNLTIYALYGKSYLTSVCTSPTKQNYDFVLLGTSHAEFLYPYLVEPILMKKMKNLGAGSAGIIPQKIQTECFFYSHNKTKKIIYIIDPWIMYSKRWNEDNYIIKNESFEYVYLLKLIENKVSPSIIFSYFRDKLLDKFEESINNAIKPPTNKTVKASIANIPASETKPLDKTTNEEKVQRQKALEGKTEEEKKIIISGWDRDRLETLYNEGKNNENFKRYSAYLEEFIKTVGKNKTDLVFIIPPTEMGSMQGREDLVNLLSSLQKHYKFEFMDLSNEMQNDDYYYDREHFTIAGVEYFTTTYLKPLIQ